MTYREDCSTDTPLCGSVDETPLVILNGTVSELAIPCTYTVVADDGTETTELIHLTAEGYTDPIVAVSSPPVGLEAAAWIDDVDDSIIKIAISAQCAAAVDDDVVRDISVLITRPTSDPLDVRTDVVIHGSLTIQAGPYEELADTDPVLSTDAMVRSLYKGMLGYGVLSDFAGSITDQTLTLTAGSAVLEGAFFDVGATPRTIDLSALSGSQRLILRWTLASETLELVMVPVAQALVKTTNVFEISLATMTESNSWSQPTFAYEVAGTLADPVGSLKWFAVDSVPMSHKLADGSAIDATIFPRLYAEFGANLPDLRGKTLVALDDRDNDFNSLADTGGSKVSTAPHTHSIQHDHASATTSSDGSHRHLMSADPNVKLRDNYLQTSGTGDAIDNAGIGTTQYTDYQGVHTHTLDVPDTGVIASGASSAGATNGNMPPYAVGVLCVRA